MLAAMLVAHGAAADRMTERRLVLASDDAQLLHALDAELGPWHVQIVVAPPPVASDATSADAEARDHDARFIVWRDGDAIAVYDRDTRALERRRLRNGALDSMAAASAATSVKTIMRLPPPDAEPAVAIETPAPLPPSNAPTLRFELDAAARDAAGAQARFGASASISPWHALGWWFGIAGELGTTSDVQAAGFKGTWSDSRLVALARYAFELSPAWAIEPDVSAGIARSSLDGSEQMATRDESATLAVFDAGALVRYRIGRWSIAAALAGSFTPGAPTYAMTQGSSTIFAVPAFAISGALVVGVDVTP
jgi:hypothetical protein